MNPLNESMHDFCYNNGNLLYSLKSVVDARGGVLGIWADTYARFWVGPTHPSMYQILVLKPIHVPKFFAQNPSSYQFYSVFIVKPIHVPKIHAQNPSMYRNFTNFRKMTHPCLYISLSKPIHVPKFHDFGGKWPTHVRRFSFQSGSCFDLERL